MRLGLVAFSKVFERVIVGLLLVMLMILILVGVGVLADLFVDFFRQLPSRLAQLDNVETLQHEMHQAFGGFLVLLLGLELLTTVRMYLTDHMIHVETVFLVAMIAVGRHVIELDFGTASMGTLLGVAAILLSLAAGYYLLKRSGLPDSGPHVTRS